MSQGFGDGGEQTDEQLMLAFTKGESAAFELLLKRHRARVFQFIVRMVKHRPTAEDVLQETWLKVVRSKGDYAVKARFSTWLLTIARTTCVDAMRREKYRNHVSLDASGGEDDETPKVERTRSEMPTPDQETARGEIQKLLLQAIDSLPIDQREVLLLREYQALPFAEIAAVVHSNENTVKSRMRYALESMRDFLVARGVDSGDAMALAVQR